MNLLGMVLGLTFLVCVVAFANTIHVPTNPLNGNHNHVEIIVGDVEENFCFPIGNVDPSFTFGRDIYFVDSQDERYDMYDVDMAAKGIAGTLHRFILTRDTALCNKVVTDERKKKGLPPGEVNTTPPPKSRDGRVREGN